MFSAIPLPGFCLYKAVSSLKYSKYFSLIYVQTYPSLWSKIWSTNFEFSKSISCFILGGMKYSYDDSLSE